MEDASNNVTSTTLEQRFNCLVCWGPKLRMVYGLCQHRLCESCLYDEEGRRRPGLDRCPVCCKANSFPEGRPDIPEDNIEAQSILGIITCVYGCGLEMWFWEQSDHASDCPAVGRLSTQPSKSRRKWKKAVNTEQSSSSERRLRSHSCVSGKQTRSSTSRRSGKRKRSS